MLCFTKLISSAASNHDIVPVKPVLKFQIQSQAPRPDNQATTTTATQARRCCPFHRQPIPCHRRFRHHVLDHHLPPSISPSRARSPSATALLLSHLRESPSSAASSLSSAINAQTTTPSPPLSPSLLLHIKSPQASQSATAIPCHLLPASSLRDRAGPR
ncbi:hypothetical protein M0R45_002229 [Rubus argutus]|uniref:Uncharacterized protein n=1 Tax=Rubus argutus TaxID=59490 RepID=A0AAW1VJ73_RUBAR